MKHKIINLMLAFSLTFSITACGNTNTDTISETEIIATENIQDDFKEKPAEENSSTINAVDKFVELYNLSSETPITDLFNIDIHDKSGGYYRTEFRTAAYENAIAKHGIASESVSMDLIEYSRGFRLYILADSYETLQKILETTIKIYDSSVTKSIIQSEIYDKIDFVGNGVSFYINDITGYYEILNKETGSCSLMLDISPISFNK